MALERHAYEPCTHKGRHGYTLPDDFREYDMCERCRRPLAGHVGPNLAGHTPSGRALPGNNRLCECGVPETSWNILPCQTPAS